MSSPSPASPEPVLNRVLLISAIDGWSVIALAGLGTLLALALGDLSGAFTGLMIVAAGAIELAGRRRLRRGDPAGMKLLIRAQLFLLAVILVYCTTRLASFDESLVQDVVRENLTPDMEAALLESGITRADIVPAVQGLFYLVNATVAFLSLVFQGGLILYYRSRTERVAASLAVPPRVAA